MNTARDLNKPTQPIKHITEAPKMIEVNSNNPQYPRWLQICKDFSLHGLAVSVLLTITGIAVTWLKVSATETKLDTSIAALGTKLETSISTLDKAVDRGFDRTQNDIKELGTEIKNLNSKTDKIETKLDYIQQDTHLIKGVLIKKP